MRFFACLLRLRYVAWMLGLFLLFAPSSARAVFTDQSAAVLLGANYITRSASLADYDADGDLDLMFQTSVGPKLYRSNFINSGGAASFTYTDVTSTMLPAGLNGGMWSAAWGDYNSDGKVDVMVGAASGTGTLLKNNGPAAFTSANVSAGLTTANFTSSSAFTQNLAWADFNNDHRLDLVIGMEGSKMHQMYLQQANGTFLESGAAVGIQQAFGTKSYGLAVGDYDGDGDMDIYLSTCSAGNIRNNFYKNMFKESGTLTFVDVADTNGTQNTNNTYGTQFVDMDNDGKLDLVVTGAENDTTQLGNPTKIYRNLGNGSFGDVDLITGQPLLSDPGKDLNGLKLVDYDNDGKLDMYFHDNQSPAGNQKLYHNDGNWHFTDVTSAMGLSGLATTGAGGYDSTWGDLDLDGDQDIINTNNSTLAGVGATPEKAYINDASTNGNHWLYVKLHGPSWDTTGIGASLYATLNTGTPNQVTLRREANSDADTFNQSDVPVHFGLGSSLFVDKLLIRWSDGTAQVISTILANQYLSVTYFPGDYNGDNVVDARDYVVWSKGFGTDFTMDDYATWRSHFGAKLVAGAGTVDGAAIPEPTAITMMMAGLAGGVFGIGRRRC
jgi:VCBS repeat protein/ASPIC/UnbV protein